MIHCAAMRASESRALCEQAASDHGFPVVSIAGVHLIDVRARYPQQYRTELDPAQLVGIGQHHDAAFYPDDPLPGDDFPAELARLDTIHRYHVGQDFGGFAYHTFGFPSGRIFLTRHLGIRAAGVKARNHELYAHCSAGAWTNGTPPLGTQLTAAMACLVFFAQVRRLLRIDGHRAWALPQYATACPGDAHHLWVPRLPAMVAAVARELGH